MARTLGDNELQHQTTPAKRIRLSDVAVKCGLSQMTVSRVLNHPEMVSEKTRNQVLQVVQNMGYLPNRLAGSLSGARTRQVAVLIPSISNVVFSAMLTSLANTLERESMQIMLGNFHYQEKSCIEQAMSFLAWQPEAMVLVGAAPEALRVALKPLNIPLVEVLELLEDPFDINIGLSHYDAGKAAALHLLSLGYRKFSVVTADTNVDTRSGMRIQGFKNVLEEYALEIVSTHEVGKRSSIKAGRECAFAILDSVKKLPEVLFCTNDDLAFGAMTALQEKSFKVPDDIGVMGFNGLELARYCLPPISTIHVDMHALGVLTAQTILERLNNPELKIAAVDIGFTVIDGASTKRM